MQRVSHAVEIMLRVCKDMALFIDWCSLYQRPRDKEQDASFARSLANVNLWYAHQLVFSLLLTAVPEGCRPYLERGWPVFERSISSLIKDSDMLLDVGKLQTDAGSLADVCTSEAGAPAQRFRANVPRHVPGIQFRRSKNLGDRYSKFLEDGKDVSGYVEEDEDGVPWVRVANCLFLPLRVGSDQVLRAMDSDFRSWVGLKHQCQAGRQPPCAPLAFRRTLLGLQFTNGADRGFVMSKYTQTFQEVLSGTEHITFAGLGWGDAEAQQLRSALPWCTSVEHVNLAANRIGDSGAHDIAEGLSSCASLKKLSLSGNRIGNCGAEGLAMALSGCTNLTTMELYDNHICDEGAEQLLAALPACGINLDGNPAKASLWMPRMGLK